MADGGVANLSLASVAEIFGVTGPAVIKWASTGCPRNADKSFHLIKVLRWREDRFQDSLRKKYASGEELVRRYRRAKAAREELFLRLEEGKLLDREEERRRDVRKAVVLGAQLRGLGRSASPVCAGRTAREICAILDDFVEHVISDFCAEDYEDEGAVADGDGEVGAPEAEAADGERVVGQPPDIERVDERGAGEVANEPNAVPA